MEHIPGNYVYKCNSVSQQSLGEAAANQMLHRIESRRAIKDGASAPAAYIVLEPQYVEGSSTSELKK